MKIISDILKKYPKKLESLDIELLVAWSIGKTRAFVLTHPEYALTDEELLSLEKSLCERLSGKPLAYITGHKEFYGLDFLVNAHTLIPRPETEVLVEEVLKFSRCHLERSFEHIEKRNRGISRECVRDLSTRGLGRDDEVVRAVGRDDESKRLGRDDGSERLSRDNRGEEFSRNDSNTLLLDIGTGSGCIPIALLKHFPFDCVIATDISPKALQVARENAQRLLPTEKTITFLESDFFSGVFSHIETLPKHSTLIITANLPYVPEHLYEASPDHPDTQGLQFEPKNALVSEAYGLSHIFTLLRSYTENRDLFPRHTVFFLEFLGDAKQVNILKKRLSELIPSHEYMFHNDLSERPRILTLTPILAMEDPL